MGATHYTDYVVVITEYFMMQLYTTRIYEQYAKRGALLDNAE